MSSYQPSPVPQPRQPAPTRPPGQPAPPQTQAGGPYPSQGGQPMPQRPAGQPQHLGAQAQHPAAQSQAPGYGQAGAPAQAPPQARPQPQAQPYAPPQPAAPQPASARGGNPETRPVPVSERPEGAPRDRLGNFAQVRSDDLDLTAATSALASSGGSDLHLTVGAPPMIRVSGGLHPLTELGVMSAEPLRRVLYAILTQAQREKFEADLELDFSYTVRDVGRFRVNMYLQRGSVGAAFRLIPNDIKPLSELGMPKIVSSFAAMPRGMVLVTGPTGSGKSTTLASIIDLANQTRSDHIITVEDPIEFLHPHKKCLVNQREVGEDTQSFANAIKSSLREDPDIILVGELRDLETMAVALTAAETGHLVFATLHTQDAAQTIDRFIDVFPAAQQAQVRTQLASALQGVVCQALAKRANGMGRIVATEVMIATPGIRNLIREGKTHQIYTAMQAGAEMGMHTMDQQLAELVRSGRITYETGLEKAHHIDDFNKLTGRDVRMKQGASSMQDAASGRLGGG
ncbi:MAG: PilT/PilU family type 4a pilus ATPase [Micrococcales bacterium]|nr:PilT/PilU family type 4a pilus ATPase [Micrococcales bacterium]